MIHSGSRNFGLKIAGEYDTKAKILCKKWFSSIPTLDLAFLPIDTQEAKDYMDAMNFALEFAKESRLQMMNSLLTCIQDSITTSLDIGYTHDIHHNYAQWEHHFGTNVIIHRKGATSAKMGESGIIPGSQGTSSYIVSGLGNPESFMSCSHGAGRKMSRSAARKNLVLADEQKRLNDLGIVHSVRNESDLDEAAGSYKDIEEVMELQKDLVSIVYKLTPLAVIKG